MATDIRDTENSAYAGVRAAQGSAGQPTRLMFHSTDTNKAYLSQAKRRLKHLQPLQEHLLAMMRRAQAIFPAGRFEKYNTVKQILVSHDARTVQLANSDLESNGSIGPLVGRFWWPFL